MATSFGDGTLGRRRRLGAALCAATLAALIAAAFAYRLGRALAAPADVQPADAIVVLGGEWPRRVQLGVDLFRRGLAPEIWLTGERRDARTTIESLELARRAGVPADAIRVLPSASTWEDGGAAAALAAREDARSMLVVTSWYHAPRALCVMKRRLAGSGVILHHDTVPGGSSGDSAWWQSPLDWYRVAREVAGFAWYWIDHGLAPWQC